MLPLHTELGARSWHGEQGLGCWGMAAGAGTAQSVHPVLTRGTGHVLPPQEIPPTEQLWQVTSRLHLGFQSCCHPERESRAVETLCMLWVNTDMSRAGSLHMGC